MSFLAFNIIKILLSLSFRSLFIEINEYFSIKRLSKQDKNKNGFKEKGHTHSPAFELQQFTSNVGDKIVARENGSRNDITSVDNFEDIALK